MLFHGVCRNNAMSRYIFTWAEMQKVKINKDNIEKSSQRKWLEHLNN